ncbi:hypothetical protein LUZ60_001840 [Juncus effusus]|nr:hypothetical protein LUZ60_001840 [Juncus effusus]
MSSSEASPSSPLVQALKEIAPFFLASTNVYIGNGNQTLLWQQNWMGQTLQFKFPELFSFLENTDETVAEGLENWENTAFRGTLSVTAERQLQLLTGHLQDVQMNQTEDQVVWRWENDGRFSIKSAYKIMSNGGLMHKDMQTLWRIKVPPKIKIFVWKAIRNRLPTVDNLQRRGVTTVNCCLLYKQQAETLDHLLALCAFTAQLWQQNATTGGHPSANTLQLIANEPTSTRTVFQLFANFAIWRERCNITFRDESRNFTSVLNSAKDDFNSWQKCTRGET